MKKIVALLLAVMMVLTAFAFTSCSKEETVNKTGENEKAESQQIKDKGKLVVGVTDYAPYDYEETAGSGKWIGFDADMAKLLGEKLGVDVEFIEIDWDEKITELKTGKIDLIWNGMTMSDDLAKEMDFSKPYAENSQVVVIKSANKDTLNSLAALKGKKVAVESGSAGEEAAIANIGEDEVTGVQGQTKALFEVIAGTSDAAVVDFSMAKSLCGTGDYKDLVMVEGISIGEEQFAVGARKGSDLIGAIDELFKETFENGKMKELQEKYGANDDGSNAIALCNF